MQSLLCISRALPRQVIFSMGGITPGQGAGVLFRILPNWCEPLLFNLFFRLVVSAAAAGGGGSS